MADSPFQSLSNSARRIGFAETVLHRHLFSERQACGIVTSWCRQGCIQVHSMVYSEQGTLWPMSADDCVGVCLQKGNEHAFAKLQFGVLLGARVRIGVSLLIPMVYSGACIAGFEVCQVF